jgi:predicted Zn-dependent protease
MNKGDYYSEKNDMTKAMEEYNAAMKMFPQNLEMQYWTAITLANNHQVNKAVEMLQKIYKKDPNWRELTKRLPKVNLLIVNDKDYEKLIR